MSLMVTCHDNSKNAITTPHYMSAGKNRTALHAGRDVLFRCYGQHWRDAVTHGRAADSESLASLELAPFSVQRVHGTGEGQQE